MKLDVKSGRIVNFVHRNITYILTVSSSRDHFLFLKVLVFYDLAKWSKSQIFPPLVSTLVYQLRIIVLHSCSKILYKNNCGTLLHPFPTSFNENFDLRLHLWGRFFYDVRRGSCASGHDVGKGPAALELALILAIGEKFCRWTLDIPWISRFKYSSPLVTGGDVGLNLFIRE